MIKQSTAEFRPYMSTKPRKRLPDEYVCNICGRKGHWIEDCWYKGKWKRPNIKRNHGIPKTHLVSVNAHTRGARQDSEGKFSMPIINAKAYLSGKRKHEPQGTYHFQEYIPEEMKCPVCKDIMKDAVMIPCCAYSCCEDCVLQQLIESQACPNCTSPQLAASLIPNTRLRKSIYDFKCGKHWRQDTKRQKLC